MEAATGTSGSTSGGRRRRPVDDWVGQTAENERESAWAVGWVERESAFEEENKARLDSREAEIRENEWKNLQKKAYKAPQN